MTELEQNADVVVEAGQRADDILHFAILQFMAMEPNDNSLLKLLGMQMSLLRHAARLSLIQKKFGAQNTEAMHLRLTRELYGDVAQFQLRDQ